MGSSARSLLVLAAPGAEGFRSALAAACKEADLEARFVGGWAEALGVVSREVPASLLLDATAPGVEKVCQRVRSDAEQANLPVLLFERKLSDRAFVKAFRWSADDLVSLESTAELVKRLRALPEGGPTAAPSVRGAALVAETDETRRSALHRLLVNAGFAVEIARTRAELDAVAGRPARLCVASTSVAEPAACVGAARAAGNSGTWIFMARAGELEKVAKSVAGLERVAVVDALDPPENVLFLANELSAAAARESRKEPRCLYGTMVAFRPPGGSKDDHGFTYNVSPRGLYVRTLAPPPDERVWLELRSPGSPRRARIEGRVAWSRPFGPHARATAPPGWGVEITSQLEAERATWEQGARELLAREGWRTSVPRSAAPPRFSSRPPPKPRSMPPRPVTGSPPVQVEAPSLTIGEAELTDADVVPAPSAVATGVADARGAASAVERSSTPPDLAEAISESSIVAAEPTPMTKDADPTDAVLEVAARAAEPAPEGLARSDATAAGGPFDGEALALRAGHPHESAGPAGRPAPSLDSRADDGVSEVPSSAPPLRRDRRRGIRVAAGVGVALAAGGAVAVLLAPGAGPTAVSSTPGASVPTRAGSARALSRSEPPVTEAGSGAVPAPAAASAAPASEASAAASASAPLAPGAPPASPGPSGSAPVGSPTLPPLAGEGAGGDGSELNWSEGYLIVRSPATADVYAHAIKYGATNTRLKVKCGLRWVRLSEPTSGGPRWISEGHTVDVACRSTTTVTIETTR